MAKTTHSFASMYTTILFGWLKPWILSGGWHSRPGVHMDHPQDNVSGQSMQR